MRRAACCRADEVTSCGDVRGVGEIERRDRCRVGLGEAERRGRGWRVGVRDVHDLGANSVRRTGGRQRATVPSIVERSSVRRGSARAISSILVMLGEFA
jgi:hypothetical protein